MCRVVLYGMGFDAKMILCMVNELGDAFGDRIVAFSDKKAGMHKGTFFGYRVIKPEEVGNEDTDMIVITSRDYEREIRHDLVNKYNVDESKLFTYKEYVRHVHINYQEGLLPAKISEPYNLGRIVVYTALQHGYDSLKPPDIIEDDVSYVCFSDDLSIESDIWEIRPFETPSVWSHRECKILPHRFLEEFDTSIWIDGNLQIVGSVKSYIKQYYKGHGSLFFPHPERHCIYDEAAAVIQLRKADRKAVSEEVGYYNQCGMPTDFGLLNASVIVRQHNLPKVIMLMEEWWNCFQKYSHRDQISLPFVLWKSGATVDINKEYIYGNQWFKWYEHSK